MVPEIVGREEELASVFALIDGVREGSLVLEGEAGIGKSTLWLAGVEHARVRGLAVPSHDQPRPSVDWLTSGSGISSRACSTTFCLRTPAPA
jgi:hypothetical protein